MTVHDFWEGLSAVASGLTAVALFFAFAQLLAARKQRHREFELIYVQRYWGIMDAMSFDITRGTPVESLSDADRLRCLHYIRLCEDELDLREQRFVTDETWELWKVGIRSQLQIQPFKDLMTTEGMPELESLRKFYDSEAGTVSDPLKLSRFWKRWYGLL